MDTEVNKEQVKWYCICFKTYWNSFHFHKERSPSSCFKKIYGPLLIIFYRNLGTGKYFSTKQKQQTKKQYMHHDKWHMSCHLRSWKQQGLVKTMVNHRVGIKPQLPGFLSLQEKWTARSFMLKCPNFKIHIFKNNLRDKRWLPTKFRLEDHKFAIAMLKKKIPQKVKGKQFQWDVWYED